MNALERCRGYFDAWAARDMNGILAAFAPRGRYEDPTTRGPLSVAGLRAHAERLWEAFPDLTFEMVSIDPIGTDRVSGQWRMRGTNTGSLNGLPPTERAVDLPGIDVVVAGPAGIESVTGYFDSVAVARQLGLEVRVQASEIGPLRFGTSVRAGARPGRRPGVIALTELVARSDADVKRIREWSREIAADSLASTGFLAFAGTTCGHRMTTLSEWTSLEAMRASMHQGLHREAMRAFFDGGLAEGATSSVWTPLRVGPWWRRCACGATSRLESMVGTCRCGRALESIC